MYIKEIKEAAVKYAKCPLMDIKAMTTMAKIYPQGDLAYWIEKRFEYVKEIKEKSNIGQAWTVSGCPDLTIIENPSRLISEYLEDYYSQDTLSHLTQSEKDNFAKKNIDTFFRLYLEYRVINNLVLDLEEKGKSKKSKWSPSTFGDMFVSLDAYDKAILWLNDRRLFVGAKTTINEPKDIALLFVSLRNFGYIKPLSSRDLSKYVPLINAKCGKTTIENTLNIKMDELRDKIKNPLFYEMPTS